MKERPIIFNGEMVRAILDGRKTQTRRVIKPQPDGPWAAPGRTMCPYGQPGDRLWVRETWAHVPRTAYGSLGMQDPSDEDMAAIYRATFDRSPPGTGWKPSIYMPKWAARIWLEIINVRVERVQEITNEGALAEGVEEHQIPHTWMFRELWDSINAKRGYSWDSNPSIWVVEFRRSDGT